MKKTVTRQESEYVAPEMEVVVLAAEKKVLSSSNEGLEEDEPIN